MHRLRRAAARREKITGEIMTTTRPYWSPYIAGGALGLTLLGTYVLMGFGVAAAGLAMLSLLGVLDLAAIAVQPTYLWPQIVGGLVLGAGFALGGY